MEYDQRDIFSEFGGILRILHDLPDFALFYFAGLSQGAHRRWGSTGPWAPSAALTGPAFFLNNLIHAAGHRRTNE